MARQSGGSGRPVQAAFMEMSGEICVYLSVQLEISGRGKNYRF